MENLIQRLSQACLHPNKPENRKLLPKILEAMQDDGCISLIGPLVKLLPSHDVLIKKVIYHCLIRLCKTEPDTSYLLANTAMKDRQDPNPLVRSLAISALCQIPPLLEQAALSLPAALRDASPYVRRSGVVSCTWLHRHSPGAAAELINTLYEMIRDPDPLVVVDSLLALEAILSSEGGVVLNKMMVVYLLGKLDSFPLLQISMAFRVLHKYKPRSEEESLELINLLDGFLQHRSWVVMFGAIRLFLTFAEGMPELEEDLLQCVKPNITKRLESSSPELVYHVIEFLVSRGEKWLKSFSVEYTLFLPKPHDSVPIRTQKLSILPALCTELNIGSIVVEICESGREERLAINAVKSICEIGRRLPACLEMCVDKLMKLLVTHNENITIEILAALQNMDLHLIQEKKLVHTMDIVASHSADNLGDRVPPSFPWLLGKFGNRFERAPYVMEKLVESFDIYSYPTQDSILTSTLRLFFTSPAECQDLLGDVLERCVQGDNIFLKNKALMYYRLLKRDVNLLKSIASGSAVNL